MGMFDLIFDVFASIIKTLFILFIVLIIALAYIIYKGISG